MHAKAFPALLFVVHHFQRCRAAENVSSPENVTAPPPPPQTKTDSLNLLTYNVWLIPFLSKDLVSMNCFRLKRSLYFFHIDVKAKSVYYAGKKASALPQDGRERRKEIQAGRPLAAGGLVPAGLPRGQEEPAEGGLLHAGNGGCQRGGVRPALQQNHAVRLQPL